MNEQIVRALKPAKQERKSLSKRLRFNVFKRDGFVCQYCGATPPEVVLEVDHIHPVSQGGADDMDNLITSCFDCNRGKADGVLSVVPESVTSKAEMMAEKLEQLKAYQRVVKQQKKHEEKMIDEVEESFRVHHDGFSFSPKFRESVRVFLGLLPFDRVIDAMQLACMRIRRRDDAIKYFCGICWKQVKERRNGQG